MREAKGREANYGWEKTDAKGEIGLKEWESEKRAELEGRVQCKERC